MKNLVIGYALITVGVAWGVGVTIAIGGWDAGGIAETFLIGGGGAPLVAGALMVYEEHTVRSAVRRLDDERPD